VTVKVDGVDSETFIENEIVMIVEVVERGEREVISSDVIFKDSLNYRNRGTRRSSGRQLFVVRRNLGSCPARMWLGSIWRGATEMLML
jgi:hypothetical protein